MVSLVWIWILKYVFICGFLQGSIISTVLFSLCILYLGHLLNSFKCTCYHWYAHNTQLYLSVSSSTTAFGTFGNASLPLLTLKYFFHLSPDKTKALVFGPDWFTEEVSHCASLLADNIKSSDQSLSIIRYYLVYLNLTFQSLPSFLSLKKHCKNETFFVTQSSRTFSTHCNCLPLIFASLPVKFKILFIA